EGARLTNVGRQTRAFFGALALHAIAAALLRLVPPPPPRQTPSSRTIELEWSRTLLPPTPRAPSELVRRSSEAAAPLPRVTRHHPAASARATASPTSATTSAAPDSEPAPPSPDARGPAQLFPHALLEQLAAQPARPAPRGDRDRETPSGWLDDAAATRTRAGLVAPVWRDVERDLVQNFHPPVDAVHDRPAGKVARVFDRLETMLKQQAAVVAGGEERLRHPLDPDSHGLRFSADSPIDLSQQGFAGVPDGLNLRALPLSQQEAVMAATGDPASWLAVEVEVTVDAAGQVTRTRVVMPSGRRAFDRYALRAVTERVAQATPPASISRWQCRAGYAASRPDAIGVHYDLSMLFDKQLRKQLDAQYPFKERVETRVALQWVKALP
ncbi:MAG TPA: TonB family protein, partial [Polyangia bacterium]|nr:TonB family protein [Polyangia bacterium]